MRFLLLAAVLMVSCPPALHAEQLPQMIVSEVVAAPIATPATSIEVTPELIEAYQAYKLAHLRWQRYRFVELPRQRQLLDSQARLADTEISILKRRQRDYQPFLLSGSYSPVRTAAENNRLALQATKQQLKLLKDERINLMRYSRQNAQLYQLDVVRAAARVRQIIAKMQKTQ